MYRKQNEKGFTLIELLIVIVILGILSGVLLSVINPAQQQLKANQTAMRSSLEKLYLAQMACVNSTTSPATECAAMVDLGVNDPAGKPTGATYTVAAPAGELTVTAALGTCSMTYTYNIAAGTTSMGAQDPDCLVDFHD